MNEQQIKQRFEQPEIDRVRRLVDEYAFVLEGIPEAIRLRFYNVLGGERIELEQSHYLQTPCMLDPLVPEQQSYASIEQALDDVLQGFLEGYRAAVRQHVEPDIAWLLPNRDFN